MSATDLACSLQLHGGRRVFLYQRGILLSDGVQLSHGGIDLRDTAELLVEAPWISLISEFTRRTSSRASVMVFWAESVFTLPSLHLVG